MFILEEINNYINTGKDHCHLIRPVLAAVMGRLQKKIKGTLIFVILSYI